MTVCDWAAMILMLTSGAFMGLMDLNAHGKRGKDPSRTWQYKYKKPLRPVKSRWEHKYYLGMYKPQFVEKFPFSTTFLVWLTDPWHKYKKVFIATLFVAISLRPEITKFGVLDAAILNAVLLTGFNIVYHWKQIRPKRLK